MLEVQVFVSMWDSELDLSFAAGEGICLRTRNRRQLSLELRTAPKCRVELQYCHIQGLPCHDNTACCVEQAFVLHSWAWQSRAFACFLCWTLSVGLKPWNCERDRGMTCHHAWFSLYFIVSLAKFFSIIARINRFFSYWCLQHSCEVLRICQVASKLSVSRRKMPWCYTPQPCFT